MDGRPDRHPLAGQARALGIETVYQDLALFDNLGPAANFYAGRELAEPRLAAARAALPATAAAMARKTTELLDRLQVGLPDMSNQVGLLSGGQRQAVAVARAAAFASNVVILDEPTAALGVRESRQRPRPHHPTPRVRLRGDRHLPRARPRHGHRGPGGRPATGPEGRRGDPDPREPASGSCH